MWALSFDACITTNGWNWAKIWWNIESGSNNTHTGISHLVFDLQPRPRSLSLSSTHSCPQLQAVIFKDLHGQMICLEASSKHRKRPKKCRTLCVVQLFVICVHDQWVKTWQQNLQNIGLRQVLVCNSNCRCVGHDTDGNGANAILMCVCHAHEWRAVLYVVLRCEDFQHKHRISSHVHYDSQTEVSAYEHCLSIQTAYYWSLALHPSRRWSCPRLRHKQTRTNNATSEGATWLCTAQASRKTTEQAPIH